MSKLIIHLMVLGTILILWVILMLSVHYKHKKYLKKIQEDLLWSEDRRRRQQERIDRQWDEVNGMWGTVRPDRERNEFNGLWQRENCQGVFRRSAWVPYDELRPKTDKLSPKKKMGKHTMR